MPWAAAWNMHSPATGRCAVSISTPAALAAVGGSYVATSANGNGDRHTGSAKLDIHQARAALNFKFN